MNLIKRTRAQAVPREPRVISRAARVRLHAMFKSSVSELTVCSREVELRLQPVTTSQDGVTETTKHNFQLSLRFKSRVYFCLCSRLCSAVFSARWIIPVWHIVPALLPANGNIQRL